MSNHSAHCLSYKRSRVRYCFKLALTWQSHAQVEAMLFLSSHALLTAFWTYCSSFCWKLQVTCDCEALHTHTLMDLFHSEESHFPFRWKVLGICDTVSVKQNYWYGFCKFNRYHRAGISLQWGLSRAGRYKYSYLSISIIVKINVKYHVSEVW